MTWGLPPKAHFTHQFHYDFDRVKNLVKKAIEGAGYTIVDEGDFILRAQKKMKLSILSLFTFERASINLFARIESGGKMTVEGVYDYRSKHGIALHDLGRLNKELSLIKADLKI